MLWKIPIPVGVLIIALLCGQTRCFLTQRNHVKDCSEALFSANTDDNCLTKPSSEEEQPASRRRFLVNSALSFLTSAATAGSFLLTGQSALAASSLQEQPLNIVPSSSAVDMNPQFNTVDDVPSDYFAQNKKIYAFVERVIDGDTIRVRHYPGYSPSLSSIGGSVTPEPLKVKGIADLTLKVRLYGVDAPEIAKKKDQISQPFAQKSKDFTSNLVYHRMVELTFLKKDQYSRAICAVQTVPKSPSIPPKDLSVELTRAGLAEIYTGGGAVYFGKKDLLEKQRQQAQAEKRGIWSLENRVSAAEAKKCIRSGAAEVNDCIREGTAAASL